MRLNFKFAYVAALLLTASVPAGTWVVDLVSSASLVYPLLVLVLIVVGFSFYALSRVDFMNRISRNRAMPIILLLFGVFLFFYGGYISFFALRAIEFHVYGLVMYSWTLDTTAIWSGVISLMWSSLWIVAGVLFIVDWVRTPVKVAEGAILAMTSFLIFWNTTLFEAHTGMRLGSGLLTYFLGYPLYLAMSFAAALLIVVGLAVCVISFRKRSVLSTSHNGRSVGHNKTGRIRGLPRQPSHSKPYTIKRCKGIAAKQ